MPPLTSQRGFVLGIWGYVAAAVVILGLIAGLIAWADRNIATTAGVKKGEANLQPKLTACEGQLTTQNAAIEAMRQEGLSKQARAASALRQAEGRARVWDGQARRLQGILASRKPTDDQSCAGAWSELRKP